MGAYYSPNDPRYEEQRAAIEAGDVYGDMIGRSKNLPIEKPEQRPVKKAGTKRQARPQN